MNMGVSPGVGSTIAGFFADINREEWAQLWAGLLGAIPAAVISAAVAAWVAVTVLGRTNEHQQKLAATASAEQRDTAFTQLKVQYELAERQLAEQRTEAARAREQAALAEVVIATEALMLVAEKTDDALRAHVPVLQGAMARWRVELGTGLMQTELLRWTNLLLVATQEVIRAERNGGLGDADRAWNDLKIAIMRMSVVAMSWSSADDSRRAQLQEKLEEFRMEHEGKKNESSEARS